MHLEMVPFSHSRSRRTEQRHLEVFEICTLTDTQKENNIYAVFETDRGATQNQEQLKLFGTAYYRSEGSGFLKISCC